MLPHRSLGLAAGFVLLCSTLLAQSKPALKHSDYEHWNSVAGVRLAPDGQSLAYFFNPAAGDGALVIRHLTTGKEIRIPSGGKSATPEPGPETPATATPEPGSLPTGLALTGGLPSYSPDSKLLIVNLPPPRSALDKAKAEKKSPADSPKTVLAIVDVATGEVKTKIERVRSFSVHGRGAGFLTYIKEGKVEEPKPKEEAKTKEETKPKELAPQPKEEAKPKKPDAADHENDEDDQQPTPKKGFPGSGSSTSITPPTTRNLPTDLVVRNLADGREWTFPDVSDFTVTKDARQLIYVVSGKDPAKQGVFVTPLGENKPEPIQMAPGRYSRLSWNENQSQLAFFGSDPPPQPVTPPASPAKPDTPTSSPPTPPATPAPSKLRVYLWSRDGKSPAQMILDSTPPGLKAGFSILERGGLNFTTDGLKLVLSVGPTPTQEPTTSSASTEPSTPPTTGTFGKFPRSFPGASSPAAGRTEEKIDLDLWHWKDELIQPMQKIRGPLERNKSYQAVYFLDSKKFQQLSDDDKTVSVPNTGDWALAQSDKKYRGMQWLSPTPRDYGLLNIRTGEARALAQGVTGSVIASPKGTSIVMFDGKHWSAVNPTDGKQVSLTQRLKVGFASDEFDNPTTPPPYGSPQWSPDEKFVYLYDKYDLWKFAVDGSSFENVTKIGRELKIRFRPIRLAEESETNLTGLDFSKPVLLAAENLETRDTGFYRMAPGDKPKLLIMGPRRYGNPSRAKNADVMLFTISTFYDYPDYYVSDGSFREVKRVTDINPKIREFNWGQAELIHYKNADGVPLSGILIKPENFDPSKQYPMMVYIYERLSQNLHNFVLPRPGTSINPTFYASNGYLVFMPDIVYTIGQPGQSALKCVLPAIQAVVDRGFVKEECIGIQGHSWGGYQIAYMVTQTNRFKAANAGAPVSNMVSAYGGIRWGSGLPRQFQYEQTQSRIGNTLWAAPMKYIENSPIFMADRVNTPLMMLHNDQDDAVPWYQGIEYYLALRRLGKEVYLFNYNGEFHGLRKRATQKDYTVRMQQFFDHHLKGAPMPAWMEKGIPYSERDQEKEQWKKLFEPEKPEKK